MNIGAGLDAPHPVILLVEDEAVIAMMQRRVLESHGFAVTHAADGDAAVAEADRNPEIALVLMDIDLGSGMDGTEAAEQILLRHDVPIVFLTSHGERKMVDRVRGITRYGYVMKSSGEFVLIEAITMALELHRAHGQIAGRNRELASTNEQLRRANAELRDSRRKIEERERKYEERRRYLEALLNHAPDAIVTLDRDHRVVEWNRGAQKLFGYTREEATGTLIDDLVAPRDTSASAEARALTAEILATPRDVLAEGVRYSKDRQPIDVLIAGAPIDMDDECIGLVVTYKDITKQKRTEELMHRNEERYRILAEHSSDVIAYLDTELRPIYVSPSATRLTGYETRHFYLRRLTETIHPADAPAVADRIASDIKSGATAARLSYRIMCRDERVVPVESILTYVRTDDESVSGIVVNQRDVSDRIAAEAQTRRWAERVEKLAEEQRLLLNEINHRVKNDMNLVRALLSLQAGQTENEETRRHLSEARHRVSVIANVYQTLSNSSSVDRLDLRTFVPDVVGAGAHGRAISLHTPEAELSVSSRVATAVGIVLNELTTNAAKYARAVGTDPSITVSVEAIGAEHVRIRVEDSGPGFPDEVIAGGRRGLGLSLVEALAAQHGGELTLGNEPVAHVEVTINRDDPDERDP